MVGIGSIDALCLSAEGRSALPRGVVLRGAKNEKAVGQEDDRSSTHLLDAKHLQAAVLTQLDHDLRKAGNRVVS